MCTHGNKNMYRLLIPSSVLAATLAGCIVTTSAGGFPARGTITDKQDGTPIEGARVRLKYSADSPYGSHDKFSESVISNVHGKFHIPAEEVQLWGGTGGLVGRINEWPSIELSKNGYCTQTVSFEEPNTDSYIDLNLEMQTSSGDNCG